jgi:hypothetical protein
MPHFFLCSWFSYSYSTISTQNLEKKSCTKCVETCLTTDIILWHLNIPMGERAWRYTWKLWWNLSLASLIKPIWNELWSILIVNCLLSYSPSCVKNNVVLMWCVLFLFFSFFSWIFFNKKILVFFVHNNWVFISCNHIWLNVMGRKTTKIKKKFKKCEPTMIKISLILSLNTKHENQRQELKICKT